MEISEGVLRLFFSPVVFADLTDRPWVFDRASFFHWFKIRDLIQKVIVDPATRRGKEKLVYRLIVNSSPPRKSLVEGERFVRDEGDPELLRVV